jgi:agmatine deiminase
MTSQRRMPAEWEPHSGTWVGWAHNPETWPGCLPEAEAEFQTLVETIAQSETVHVLVHDAAHRAEVAARLGTANVKLHEVPTNDAWLRDTGPSFVHGGAGDLVAVDWGFNAWGGKYEPFDSDAAVAARIAALCGARHERAALTCEGGALEVDGEGTLLATRSSVLSDTRNPGITPERAALELELRLGVSRTIWLDAALAGDDTDGHVDNIARFVAPGRVVIAQAHDPAHPNAEILRACRDALAREHDAHGRPLEVIDLPLPPPIEYQGTALPASHVNFYIANDRVVVPCFGTASDARALDILAKCFPGRRIVGISGRVLVRGLGGPHCLTQQQPRAAR